MGASPLEPYNGAAAIVAIKQNVRFSVLCASDPYAVAGIISTFDLTPDLVAGPAANTNASIALVHKLTGLPALNLLGRESIWELRNRLRTALDLENHNG